MNTALGISVYSSGCCNYVGYILVGRLVGHAISCNLKHKTVDSVQFVGRALRLSAADCVSDRKVRSQQITQPLKPKASSCSLTLHPKAPLAA